MKKLICLIIPVALLTGQLKLSSVLVADGFKKPIYVTSHPEDSKLLYVLEQAGRIMLIEQGKRLKKAFLDIRTEVVTPNRPGDERGLLGFAFHPNHIKNGKFYINYMNNEGYTVVAEFQTKTR